MKNIKIQELANFELLKGLDSNERRTIRDNLRERSYSANKVVFHEGDRGGTLFFLLEGEVEISQALTLNMGDTKAYDNREKSIIKLTGEMSPVFGEVSLFSKEDRRTATVTSLTDSRMGLLAEKNFFEILDSDRELGYKIMINLTSIVCSRLVTANQNVLKLTTAISLILEK